MCCDHAYWTGRQKEKSVTIEGETAKYLRLNNLALEGRPHDLAFTTHVCRGNYNSTWAASGGYEPVAPILFAKENVDAYYLEFDDDRSGGFASCEIGNQLTEEQQWAKLALVKEIAHEVWGD